MDDAADILGTSDIGTNTKQILEFYAKPGPMTLLNKQHGHTVKNLPNDIGMLVEIVQGLVIHQFAAKPFYGVDVSIERINKESHIRKSADLLDAIHAISIAPLSEKRAPADRLVGVCHHFAKLLLTMLRAKGIPARMRYGFGDYFNPNFYEDHSLVEYWNRGKRCWTLVDPQFDGIWQQRLHIKHNIFDVSRDRFLTAGSAWIKCRDGELNAAAFGIFNMRGWWFVAGNLIKDIAALNKMEMLQWDGWTGMPRPNNAMKDKKRLAFFDELAELTRDPDASFRKIRKLYQDKSKKVYVPERVFNAIRRHLERI